MFLQKRHEFGRLFFSSSIVPRRDISEYDFPQEGTIKYTLS